VNRVNQRCAAGINPNGGTVSYLVFARKWRPQSFDEVLAQDHVTVTLRNAIETGRIGHSYLMTGPRGVGKTTIARILAKSLNCEKGPTPEPCQVCDSCRRITAGSHLDVQEIDGASNRGIDQIRELREKAMYATASGKYRIYIIDEVHMLTTEAFNALLKILEEPPDSVIFVFATTQPRKVPDTILSRCQRFDLRRIPLHEMAAYLSREAAAEDITLDQTALSLVCRASGGSMRDALSLIDQLVSYCGNEVVGDEVARLLGMVESDILGDLTAAILAGKAAEALDTVSGALAEGYSVEELIEALTGFLRNLLLVTTGASGGIEDVPENEIKVLSELAPDIPDVAVLNVLRIISGASAEARRSDLPRVVFETALMTAAKMSIAFGIDSLPAVADRVARSSARQPVKVPQESSILKSDSPQDPAETASADVIAQEEEAQEEPQAKDSSEEEQSPETVPDPDVSSEEAPPQESEDTESVVMNDDKEKKDAVEKEKEVTREIMGLFDAV